MPGLFQVKELEARKRALAAESEVLRQTLKFEARNIWFHVAYAKRRFLQISTFSPFVMLGIPAAGYLVRKMFTRRQARARKKKTAAARLITSALFGWRMYRKVAPFLRSLFSRQEELREGAEVGQRATSWQ